MSLKKINTLFFVFIFAVSAAWVYCSGKDLTWDALNYHGYAAANVFGERLDDDFFAASVQGYLNPLAYFPLRVLDALGFGSYFVALGLTVLHALNFLLIGLITLKVYAGENPRVGLALSIGLALSTSLFWSLVGSTFIDLIVSLPVLAALFILLDKSGNVRVVLAGLLMGFAVALKLSAVVYAVAATALLIGPSIGVFFRKVFIYCLAGLSGFLLFYSYWGALLWIKYKSPFFPFFNQVFGSPYFDSVNISINRFIPQTLHEIFFLPFEIALPKYWVYTELLNPDVKILVLWLVFIVVFLRSVIFKKNDASRSEIIGQNRLALFWVMAYFLWMFTSSSGRYGVVLFMLAGTLIWSFLTRISTRSAVYFSLGIILFQSVTLAITGISRWGDRSEWTENWFEFKVPDELTQKPFLYMSVGHNSMSFMVSLVHEESTFINISGQYSISEEGELGDNVAQHISANRRIRSLVPYFGHLDGGGVVTLYNDLSHFPYMRFGLEPEDNCVVISQVTQKKEVKKMVSCELAYSSQTKSAFERSAQVEKIVAFVESSCETMFSPSGAALEIGQNSWKKFYLNSDVRLVYENDTVYIKKPRQLEPVVLDKATLQKADVSVIAGLINCDST